MARVQLQLVSKTFANGVRAVRDLSIDVARGELFVLVGPSGSGKTTTLRLIAGLDRPTAGEILIDDRRVNDVPPAKRGVAMVFQSAALYPHFSARQNIAFGLAMQRLPVAEIRRRVDKAAETLVITGLLDRRPAELSGGERSRVAIGRAIVRRPEVLLFDEPLSGLDLPQRAQLRLEIARLPAALSTTIVYVTHDQAEAMTLGNRICVMDQGAVQQIDAPLAVYQRPANAFVAAFIGSPGMNLLPGRVNAGRFRLASVGEPDAAPDLCVGVGPGIQDGPIALGIRPHDFVLGGNGQPQLAVVATRVERLGHETAVHFELAGGRHSARLPADAAVQPGERIRLSFRDGSVHFFAADGCRIERGEN